MKPDRISRSGQIRDYGLCLALIVLLNIVLFHSGLYKYICKPDSYAGNVYTRLTLLERVEERSQEPPVVIMGDSTIEDGIVAKQLTETTGKPVANIAMPATGPLVWLHYFRSIDPHRDRFGTIVLMVTPQDVRTVPHEEGIQSLIAVSPPHIFWDYLNTFQDSWRNLGYYYAAIDRFYAFRRDLRDLLLSPDRLLHLSSLRQAELKRLDEPPGDHTDVCDVQLNPGARKVLRWGPIKDPATRQVINKTLTRTHQLNQAPDVTGILEPVERIVRHYEGSSARILIVSFPFAWNHQVDPQHPVIQKYFQRLKKLDKSPTVAHWDATSLPLFQDCANFYDFRHLNVKGRNTFTSELGKVLARNAF